MNGENIQNETETKTICESQISEHKMNILDREIGYCRYGKGQTNFLFICGGVGCYKKDYPESMLSAYDPEIVTIICIDPPGYGTSRPPDRKQEINRCKKDAGYCIKLMETLELTPFVVLGWSEGGRTAIHVGGQGKTLVSHIILLSTSTQVDFRGDMAFKGMRNTTHWLPTAKESYLQHYSEEFLREQWAALCDVVAIVYRDLGGRFPSDQVLSSLKMPVLIIYGALDRFVLDPKLMSNKIKNARYSKKYFLRIKMAVLHKIPSKKFWLKSQIFGYTNFCPYPKRWAKSFFSLPVRKGKLETG
ncbi:unnamed protein product [Meloidogyne enterolobii]|uniref:Uncharacterized protein n=1 Tax=Meloidogyne enterolobii TaxID=390850 RepID=A0ACB0Y5Y1_MELEN